MSEWISVEKRLPPEAASVIAYAPTAGEGGRRMRACYVPARTYEMTVDADYEGDIDENGTEWVPEGWYEDTVYGEQYRIPVPVTHWQPLPPPPKTDETPRG